MVLGASTSSKLCGAGGAPDRFLSACASSRAFAGGFWGQLLTTWAAGFAAGNNNIILYAPQHATLQASFALTSSFPTFLQRLDFLAIQLQS